MMNEEILRCYRVLEIEPGASFSIVKQAYRQLVKVWHPDRFQNDPSLQHKAQEKLKDINAAYSLILDFFETSAAKPESKPDNSQGQKTVDEKAEFYKIGYSFYYGEGRPKDFNEAAKYLLKSAQLGHAQAQTLLGFMYYRGEGVSKDMGLAAEWWIKAAKQGQALAQDSLGCIYKDHFGSNILAKTLSNVVGWDIGDSKIEAYKWFNLAVTNGLVQGCTGMWEVATCMTQGQINEAKLRASKYYPVYPNISTSQAIHEWLGFYVAEIQNNKKFVKWYDQVASALQEHKGIESDIIEHTTILLQNDFFGKKPQQAQAFFQNVGSAWKGVFGQKTNRTDFVRMISLRMKDDAWSAFSPKYVRKRQNILNYLWLKIYAGK